MLVKKNPFIHTIEYNVILNYKIYMTSFSSPYAIITLDNFTKDVYE